MSGIFVTKQRSRVSHEAIDALGVIFKMET